MTKIYGTSDDLIEVEGIGEISAFGTDDQERGVLVVCSDGTMVEVKYGKHGRAIWAINVIKAGNLYEKHELCDNEDAKIYSDVVHFAAELAWAYVAKDWEIVK